MVAGGYSSGRVVGDAISDLIISICARSFVFG